MNKIMDDKLNGIINGISAKQKKGIAIYRLYGC